MKIVEVGDHALYLSCSEIGLEIEFSPHEHIVAASLPAYLWDSRVEGLCGEDIFLSSSTSRKFGYQLLGLGIVFITPNLYILITG